MFSSLIPFCVLACIGYVTAAPSPDMDFPAPATPHTSVSPWVAIRTDEAAWQSACGHEKRVGAVCLDASFGQREMFLVQSHARQDVVFSGGGHYFHAYCPNLDKGEKPYTIRYAGEHDIVYLRIVGRRETQRCCPTQCLDGAHEESVTHCVEPAAIWAESFPPSNVLFDPVRSEHI